jgi:hypothetical protein
VFASRRVRGAQYSINGIPKKSEISPVRLRVSSLFPTEMLVPFSVSLAGDREFDLFLADACRRLVKL